MAINKSSLAHPAAYVHGFIHFITAFALSQSFYIALLIMLLHIIIDTRIPVKWWMRVYRQTTDGDYAIHVQIWLDQVLHIVVIYLAVMLLG
jgi:hypothetical protein